MVTYRVKNPSERLYLHVKEIIASVLTSIKSCVKEFRPEDFAGQNIDRKWKEWIENFELVLEFEGIKNTGNKRKAALLTVGGSELREIFSTLNPENDSYDSAKESLTNYFTPKKNLTAQRYRFFCAKPTSPEEKHDHWVTRLRKIGK